MAVETTPAQRLEELGFPREKYEGWDYQHFGPFSENGSRGLDFSGIPGIGDDGKPLLGLYQSGGALGAEDVIKAGKRALAKALWAVEIDGRPLSHYTPHKLEVLIGAPPQDPGLGAIANGLSEMLLSVFGIGMDDSPTTKGVRATYGVNMPFAIEPILYLKRRQ